ncbi:MAG: glycoside hydrolase family 6 protein, partial [Nocardioides sp.]
RKTRGLFVDPLMPAYKQGGVYRTKIGKRAQALWIIPEAYPKGRVKGVVRAYTSRALKAKKTPMLVVYGIPGRDCGSHSSSGALKNAKQYRAWINKVAAGVSGQKAIVIMEPDALPLFSSSVAACPTKPNGWKGMLRYANKRLGKTDAWVYLDAGHSDWRPFDDRPSFLKQAGIKHVRGFSTNVSNFRTTASEKRYATTLLQGLRSIGIKSKRYVIDTSRNGSKDPVDADVLNPTWARVGQAPRLLFQGAFDGRLWVKHPGESDGQVNGGNSSGKWCNLLADRLLNRQPSQGSCPE